MEWNNNFHKKFIYQGFQTGVFSFFDTHWSKIIIDFYKYKVYNNMVDVITLRIMQHRDMEYYMTLMVQRNDIKMKI